MKENGGKEAEAGPGGETAPVKRQVRVNPLMKLAEARQNKERTNSPKRKAKSEGKQENVEQEKGNVSNLIQKKTSFMIDLLQIY